MNSIINNALSQRERPPVLWSHRDIPLPTGNHLCGRVAYMPEPLSIPVESDLEARTVRFLLAQPNLVAVHAQPFTLSYRDSDDRPHRYTPDFLVVFDRLTRALLRLGFKRWTVVEVKPAALANRHADDIRRRLEAVRLHLGFAVLCFTDADLPTGRA